MKRPLHLRPLATGLAILAAGAALATGVSRPTLLPGATDLAPVLASGSGLEGVVPGSAFGGGDGQFNWVPGHLARFHDPLKFYP